MEDRIVEILQKEQKDKRWKTEGDTEEIRGVAQRRIFQQRVLGEDIQAERGFIRNHYLKETISYEDPK